MEEMISFKGFHNVFFRYVQNGLKHEEAYDKTENEYMSAYKVTEPKFASYESFKRCKSYHYKKHGKI